MEHLPGFNLLEVDSHPSNPRSLEDSLTKKGTYTVPLTAYILLVEYALAMETKRRKDEAQERKEKRNLAALKISLGTLLVALTLAVAPTPGSSPDKLLFTIIKSFFSG